MKFSSKLWTIGIAIIIGWVIAFLCYKGHEALTLNSVGAPTVALIEEKFVEPKCPDASLNCPSVPILDCKTVPSAVNDLIFPMVDVVRPRWNCKKTNPLMGKQCHLLLTQIGESLWTRDELIDDAQYLKEFLRYYAEDSSRRQNDGGMRLSHQFAVWSLLRKLKPHFVIETGRFKGLGIATIRGALGADVRIFSLDTKDHGGWVDSNTNTFYWGLKNPSSRPNSFAFVDIANVNWTDPIYGIDPRSTLVLLDDHQSVERRVAELSKFGFRRYYVDDNPPSPAGDSLCPKALSDIRSGYAEYGYAIPIRDSFNEVKSSATYGELLHRGQKFFEQVRTYIEFPPLVLHDSYYLEKAREYHMPSAQEIWESTPEPLLTLNHAALHGLQFDAKEAGYYSCAYVELF